MPWSGHFIGDQIAGGYVAVTPGHDLPLGALSWRDDAEGGLNFIFSVSPQARQKEAIAVELAQMAPDQSLRQRNWLPEDSVGRQALESHGFKVSRRGSVYEIPLDKVDARLMRLHALLEAKRPLKAGQEVSSWRTEYGLPVRRIALEEHLADPASLDALLTPDSSQSLCPVASSLAVDQGRLVGFFISVIRDDVCEVPVRWVARSHRNTWVNARLMLHSLMHGRVMHPNVTRMRYRGDEAMHAETHQLFQRFGGRRSASSVRLQRDAKSVFGE